MDTPLPAYSAHPEVPFATREQFMELVSIWYTNAYVLQTRDWQPDPIVYLSDYTIPYRMTHELLDQLVSDGILIYKPSPSGITQRWFVKGAQ